MFLFGTALSFTAILNLEGWRDGVEWDGREQKVGFAEKKLRLTQKMA